MSLKLAGSECTPLVMPDYCPIDAQFALFLSHMGADIGTFDTFMMQLILLTRVPLTPSLSHVRGEG